MDNDVSKVWAWHDFYSLAGSASASLVGLLVVAVSLHLSRVVAKDSRHLLSFANHTFSSFMYILMIALFFAIPGQDANDLGWELALLGLITTARQSRYALEMRRLRISGTTSSDHHEIASRTTVPILCYAGVTVVGIRLASGGSPRVLAALVSVVMLLLLTASRNAWHLLIELGKPTNDAP